MGYEIRPQRGVGDIEFGMSSTEVRARLQAEFKSFKRTPSADYPCDYFPKIGVFAYYKASGSLEAIEFSSPAQLIFAGKNLLGMALQDAVALLAAEDPAVERSTDGARSRLLGIALYAPDAKEDPQAPCESAMVCELGYWQVS